MRRYPHLYEINAAVFLRRLSRKYGRTLTLATIPDEEWQQLAALGFDLVWLMGVWQRSPGARRQALLDPGLRRAYDQALPDWSDDDVSASPYAIYTYSLDPSLGKAGELAQLKQKLNRYGLGLVLDFVPNHLAFDHPWTLSHPERFVQGSQADVATHPDWFFSPDGKLYLAHGKDPYFPPWSDTAQVNFSSNDLRQALTNELLGIAQVADGVRCDMAMLALSHVFEDVWGHTIADYRRPELEFWTEAIERLRQQRADFLLLGEVYWGLEDKLQQLGFDFTYDKTFYDRLLSGNVADIRSHLTLAEPQQQRSARFIENHDEARAVTAFGRERSLAAATIMATVPGLRFFQDGQLEGRRQRLPIQLLRQPAEAADLEIRQFYQRLMAASNSAAFHEGKWRLEEVSQTGQDSDTQPNLLAWSWQYQTQLKIVIVNYSPNPAQGWLKMPPLPQAREGGGLRDQLTGQTLISDLSTVPSQGWPINLGAWQATIF